MTSVEDLRLGRPEGGASKAWTSDRASLIDHSKYHVPSWNAAENSMRRTQDEEQDAKPPCAWWLQGVAEIHWRLLPSASDILLKLAHTAGRGLGRHETVASVLAITVKLLTVRFFGGNRSSVNSFGTLVKKCHLWMRSIQINLRVSASNEILEWDDAKHVAQTPEISGDASLASSDLLILEIGTRNGG